MPLAIGQALSFYEILGSLGAGGMGEVYRARDTRLDREVAIKVLPGELAADAERAARFEREAKALATLNHPNVAQVYGIDRVDGVHFMAMELVPGDDLDAVLSTGPLSLEEALDTCRQIAEGLEAAHEERVVHRDLKPSNVRRTHQGAVKVLDFGLAKVTGPKGAGGGKADNVLSTREGVALGTPTYMAPEQARGRSVDRRVDVWAFGCVLFECLTGQRAFEGETVSDVIGAVLEREPRWEALPARTPARVRELVERCLNKDARSRLRDIGDARVELERALAEREWMQASAGARAEPGSTPPPWMRWLPLGLAPLLALAGVLAWKALAPSPEPSRELRLSIGVERSLQNVFPRISPDGSAVVHGGEFTAAGLDSVHGLFRRDLDSFESQPLAGTEHARTFCFSPDGTSIAALVERSGPSGELTLVRVPLRGDVPSVDLGPWPRQGRRDGELAWTADSVIVGSADPNQLVLFEVDSARTEFVDVQRAFERPGAPVDVFRAVDEQRVFGRTHYYGERGYMSALVSVDLETGQEAIVQRDAEYGAITRDGRLLFTRGETLFEAPLDSSRLQTTGAPVPLSNGLRTVNAWRSAWFDMSREGTLIWLPGGRRGMDVYLAVFERTGELTAFLPERMLHDGSLVASADGDYFTSLMVSADGRRVEIWGSPVDEPKLEPVLTAAGTDYLNGITFGDSIAFLRSSAEGQQGVFIAPLDDPDSARLVLASEPDGPGYSVVAVTPDQKHVVVGKQDDQGVLYWTLPLDGSGATDLEVLFRTAADQFWPKFSPDGKWIAYVTDEADRSVIVVQRFEGRAVRGSKQRVPMPSDEVPWDFAWSRDPSTELNEFVMVANDRKSVYRVVMSNSDTGHFEQPALTGVIDDAYLLDVVSIRDGRWLCLLQDPVEQEVERIAVVVGGL